MKTDFKKYYQDLPDGVAEKLRDARVKPEQLKKMEDGEILSLEGITDENLEQIRQNYEAEIKEEKEDLKSKKPSKKEEKEKLAKPKIKKPKKIRSARYNILKTKIKIYRRQIWRICKSRNIVQTLIISSYSGIYKFGYMPLISNHIMSGF